MTQLKRNKLKKALSGNKKPILKIPSVVYKHCYPRMCHYKATIEEGKAHLSQHSRSIFSGCREIICGEVVSALAQIEHYEYPSEGPNNKDLYIYYISLMFIEANYENMKRGLRILHYFEKLAGFDLTFIKPIKLVSKDNAAVLMYGPQDIVYLCGPKEWTQTVTFLSLYLMIVKLIIKYPVKPRETAHKYFKRVSKESNVEFTLENYLKKLLKIHPDIITILMKHYKELNDSIDYSDCEWEVDDLEVEGVNMLTQEAKLTVENPLNWSGPHKDFIGVLSELLKKYEGERCL